VRGRCSAAIIRSCVTDHTPQWAKYRRRRRFNRLIVLLT